MTEPIDTYGFIESIAVNPQESRRLLELIGSAKTWAGGYLDMPLVLLAAAASLLEDAEKIGAGPATTPVKTLVVAAVGILVAQCDAANRLKGNLHEEGALNDVLDR